MASKTLPVNVDVLVPGDYAGPKKGALRILIQDVSEQDAPAQTIASKKIAASIAPGGRLTARVEVPATAIDPKRSYSVRAHISAHGDVTAVQSGDLISTQSAPVLTHGHGSTASIALRSVK